MGLNPYPSEAEKPSRLAEAIEARQSRWQSGHIAVVIRPIGEQAPRLTVGDGGSAASFQFADDTFSVAGDVQYTAERADGEPLPGWLSFDPATRTFRVTEPSRAEPVRLRVRAENSSGVYARDHFTLKPGDAT
jgi:hypothetical protein